MEIKKVAEEQLKKHGFRVTKARKEVLKKLNDAKKPIGIEVLQKVVPEVNATTLYRMMTDFVEVGLVEAHDLGHGHMDYELSSKPHHHHVVCESCGLVEDVYACKESCLLKTTIEKSTKHFTSIKTNNITFFGTCTSCA